MGALCNANPQFTASVLEDYIRPIFRLVRISSVTHVSVDSRQAGRQFTVQIVSVILKPSVFWFCMIDQVWSVIKI